MTYCAAESMSLSRFVAVAGGAAVATVGLNTFAAAVQDAALPATLATSRCRTDARCAASPSLGRTLHRGNGSVSPGRCWWRGKRGLRLEMSQTL